ncbi:adhesion G-protein coupled receptor G5-like [Lampris incognitus]|uniref:adhesion G-protein coupled receptor G5-like n=1 Tax=Lampris incognitus TaxID=2546036 RepID=UPI0024B54629|nr:adhesion G-protein coupled receptor G5-like [Lampris incognitus]
MEPRLADALTLVVTLLAVLSSGSCENDRDFKHCGTWLHGNKPLRLIYDISPGCKDISISANETCLSVEGKITAKCYQAGEFTVGKSGSSLGGQSHFCLYWEPLLDQLWVQVGGQNHTLCQPAGLQDLCCTDLSQGPNGANGAYGIINGTIKDDVASYKTLMSYTFFGDLINCKREFCDEANQGSNQINMIEETVMRSQALGIVLLPCAQSTVVEMNEDFQGYNVTLPAPKGVLPESIPSIQLPSCLKPAGRKTTKVVCTFFNNASFFKGKHQDNEILQDVVGITVENEVITSLPEPVRIGFHHRAIPRTYSRKCVSWDTRKDPHSVNWKDDGCLTVEKGMEDTDCLCNHLTFFSILVQLEPRPVHHLVALTAITSLGCAISVISCVVLIVFLSKKNRKAKEQSSPDHRGLAISLFFLNLLFFFTGILANLGGDRLCQWVGAGLHYALLSSFTWMGIEIFHTFWMVVMVFHPAPKPYVWYIIGFGLPAVLVFILVAIGNIYGVRKVVPSDDIHNPYLMCWMKSTDSAILAHYLTNVTMLAALVVSGLTMLYLVYRQIRTRDEWRQNRVTFFSIWGLSCLFGTTWGINFLDFGPLSDFFLFLFCILNSFQGFFLMLRFYILSWVRRQASSSDLGTSSTGLTRQQMLQPQEKN